MAVFQRIEQHGSYPTLSTEELVQLLQAEQSAELSDAQVQGEDELSASIISHSKTPARHLFSIATDVSEDDCVPVLTRIDFCIDVLTAALVKEKNPLGLLSTLGGETPNPVQFVAILHYLAHREYSADAIIGSDLLHRYFVSQLCDADELVGTYQMLREHRDSLSPESAIRAILTAILTSANKILCEVRGFENKTLDGAEHQALIELQHKATADVAIDYLSLLPKQLAFDGPITSVDHPYYLVSRQLQLSVAINDTENLDNLFHLFGVSFLLELLKYLVTDLPVPAGCKSGEITTLMNRDGAPVDWLFATLDTLDDDSLCRFAQLLMHTDAQFREDDEEKRNLIYFYLCSHSLRVEKYQMLYENGLEWFVIFAHPPILHKLGKTDFDKLFAKPKWPTNNPIVIETALMWLSHSHFFDDYKEQVVSVAYSYFLRQNLFPMREPQTFYNSLMAFPAVVLPLWKEEVQKQKQRLTELAHKVVSGEAKISTALSEFGGRYGRIERLADYQPFPYGDCPREQMEFYVLVLEHYVDSTPQPDLVEFIQSTLLTDVCADDRPAFLTALVLKALCVSSHPGLQLSVKAALVQLGLSDGWQEEHVKGTPVLLYALANTNRTLLMSEDCWGDETIRERRIIALENHCITAYEQTLLQLFQTSKESLALLLDCLPVAMKDWWLLRRDNSGRGFFHDMAADSVAIELLLSAVNPAQRLGAVTMVDTTASLEQRTPLMIAAQENKQSLLQMVYSLPVQDRLSALTEGKSGQPSVWMLLAAKASYTEEDILYLLSLIAAVPNDDRGKLFCHMNREFSLVDSLLVRLIDRDVPLPDGATGLITMDDSLSDVTQFGQLLFSLLSDATLMECLGSVSVITTKEDVVGPPVIETLLQVIAMTPTRIDAMIARIGTSLLMRIRDCHGHGLMHYAIMHDTAYHYYNQHGREQRFELMQQPDGDGLLPAELAASLHKEAFIDHVIADNAICNHQLFNQRHPLRRCSSLESIALISHSARTYVSKVLRSLDENQAVQALLHSQVRGAPLYTSDLFAAPESFAAVPLPDSLLRAARQLHLMHHQHQPGRLRSLLSPLWAIPPEAMIFGSAYHQMMESETACDLAGVVRSLIETDLHPHPVLRESFIQGFVDVDQEPHSLPERYTSDIVRTWPGQESFEQDYLAF